MKETIIERGAKPLLEVIRGSKSFGLDNPESDTDTTGVYLGPPPWFLGLGIGREDKIASPKNDDSWYEIGKFYTLLGKSNPEVLVTLFTPPSLILEKHSSMDILIRERESFITKECFPSFSHYATSQIKKAKSLKKAINIDPKEVKERKDLLKFCVVAKGGGLWILDRWLKESGLDQSDMAVSRVSKGIDTYALYRDIPGARGILKDLDSTQPRLTSIPKELGESNFVCHFQVRTEAFSNHCKDYKRYWDWVNSRNKERYQLNRGYDFDSKNMMHCVRLLTMAKEIAQGKGVLLDRTGIDKDFLLGIKNHEINYDEIMKYSESLALELPSLIEKSKIPDSVDLGKLEKILLEIRSF